MIYLFMIINILMVNLEVMLSFYVFLSNLVIGEIIILIVIFWLVVVSLILIFVGVIGGIWLVGKDLGYGLVVIIGGLFGFVGVIFAVIVGLIILKFV